MSIMICVKGAGGIVLAAESRRTIFHTDPSQQHEYVTQDGVLKLFSFDPPHQWWAAALCWTRTDIEPTLGELVPEIRAKLPPHRISVSEYAQHVHEALVRRAGLGSIPVEMRAIVTGFDEGETAGRVFIIEVPASPAPVEHHAGAFGISYGGQKEYVDRLLRGYDGLLVVEDKDLQNDLQTSLPLDTMSLLDCAALALFLIRTTIDMQRFIGEFAVQGTGGPIDAVFGTAAGGLHYMRQKASAPIGPGSRTLRRYNAMRPVVAIDVLPDVSRVASYTVRQ